MDRRRFLTLSSIGAAGLVTGCGGAGTDQRSAASSASSPPPPPQTTFDFSMNVIDGFAYMFAKDGSRLILGGLDTSEMKHPMLVRVLRGSAKVTKGSIAPAGDTFDLTGWHTVLDLGSAGQGLRLPANELPKGETSCVMTEAQWNNLAWLPHVSRIYPNATLVDGWLAQLNSRLVVKGGTISVAKGPEAMWEFRTKAEAKARWKQPMSDRVTIAHQVAGDVARLNLYQAKAAEPASTDAPDAVIEITHDRGGMVLDTAISFEPAIGSYSKGQPVEHFARYQRLTTAKGDPVLPFFEPCVKGKDRTPGNFCPYAQYEFA